MSEEVLVSVEQGVMVITINRPEAKNALTKKASEGIAAAMDELESNADIHVAIITGAGNTFCSGMDLKGFVTGELPIVEGRGFGGLAEKPPRKPLIAAVEGYALAGGCELLLVSDLIVASSEAKFGIPETKRGLAAGAGGLMRLPRQIPQRIAMELALIGGLMEANRAYEVGLINRVVEPGSALQSAKEMAAKIAANGPLAVAASKQVIIESQDWSLEEMFEKQMPILNSVFTSQDAIEGATAFAEKRAPQWKSK